MTGLGTLSLGGGHSLPERLFLAVLDPESAPVRRLLQQARQDQRLFDATHGRRARSLVITVMNDIYLSSLLPETIAYRYLKHDLMAEVEA